MIGQIFDDNEYWFCLMFQYWINVKVFMFLNLSSKQIAYRWSNYIGKKKWGF